MKTLITILATISLIGCVPNYDKLIVKEIKKDGNKNCQVILGYNTQVTLKDLTISNCPCDRFKVGENPFKDEK